MVHSGANDLPAGCVYLFRLAFLLALLGSGALQAGVHPSVRDHLKTHSSARVVVLFDVPARVTGAGDSMPDAIRRRGDRIVAESAPGARVYRRFEIQPALALEIDLAALETLAADPRIRAISLDPGGGAGVTAYRPFTDIVNIDQLAADTGPGLTGMGMKVAIVDSGIDLGHPDLAGTVSDQACFCSGSAGSGGCCPAGQATQFGAGAAADENGHGTWVAGIVVGQGQVAPGGGVPDAEVVAVRVLDAENRFCCASDIAAAFEWIALNHPDTAVVNASISTDMLFPGECDAGQAWQELLSSSVAMLGANQTLVVSISGNDARPNRMAAPGCLRETVATGASLSPGQGPSRFGVCENPGRGERIACFSNTSPVLDLVAPGAGTVTTALGGGFINGVFGTSFAAPLVTACATQIMQAGGGPPAAVREALRQSPVHLTDSRNSTMPARLDCVAAIEFLLGDQIVDEPVNFGMSGSWSNSANPRQGLVLDVVSAQTPPQVVVYWFTFSEFPDGAAGQRWFLAQGPFEPGAASVDLDVYRFTGGAFEQPTPVAQRERVGEANLTFDSCGSARWSFSITLDGRAEPISDSFPVQRISPDYACSSLR